MYWSNRAWNWSHELWGWHRLIHVCRKWRSLVLASPRRLDLQLVYTFKRKACVMKQALDRWPTLPIAISYAWNYTGRPPLTLEDEINVTFALYHPNRIRHINLFLTGSLLLEIGAQSFPALEYLWLRSSNLTESPLTLPVGFLGGSAPRLRQICIDGVIFPSLPLLLSSTRDLVSLRLSSVSRSAYFSPETLSIGLSAATRLKSLHIDFLPSASYVFGETGSVGRQVTARAILPVLTKFHFVGDSAYIVDLIPRIDSPILDQLFKPSAFGTRHLSQFTNRSNLLRLAPTHRSILLMGDQIFVTGGQQTHPYYPGRDGFFLRITSEDMGPQVTLPHFLKRLSVHCFSMQQLDLKSFLPCLPWLNPEDINSALWVDFFCHLKRVTRLEVDGVFVQIIGSVLKHLPGGMVCRVFPALLGLHVGKCEVPGLFQEFANARRLSGSPITVHYATSQRPHLS